MFKSTKRIFLNGVLQWLAEMGLAALIEEENENLIYRNDSDVSIGRHLRDLLSSPIMINNDRILANVAASALLGEVATSIRG